MGQKFEFHQTLHKHLLEEVLPFAVSRGSSDFVSMGFPELLKGSHLLDFP